MLSETVLYFKKVKDLCKSVEPEGQRTPGIATKSSQAQVSGNASTQELYLDLGELFKPLNMLCVTEFKCQRGKQPPYVCVSCCFSRSYHMLRNKRSGYGTCLSTGNCCLSRTFCILEKNKYS